MALVREVGHTAYLPMDTITKLREAYKDVKGAKTNITNAHKQHTNADVVFGATGFALEKLERALKTIEEVAGELKARKSWGDDAT